MAKAAATPARTVAVTIGIRPNISDVIAAMHDDIYSLPRPAYFGARAEFTGNDEAWSAHCKGVREEVSQDVQATMAAILTACKGATVTVYVDTLAFGIREANGQWSLWPTVADADDVRQFGALLRSMGATVTALSQ